MHLQTPLYLRFGNFAHVFPPREVNIYILRLTDGRVAIAIIYLHKQTSQQAAVLYLTWLQSVVTPRPPHRSSAPSSPHAMGTVRRARRLDVHTHKHKGHKDVSANQKEVDSYFGLGSFPFTPGSR